jgi:hypothetical protein
VRCLTNLATPQKTESGCGDETRTRTPSFTRRVLCYPIELRRNLVDWEGFKPSQEVCRTSMLSLHHQPREFGRGGGSRTRTLPFMRRLLFHLSYSAILILEARGGVEPRAFPPGSCRFGLEDRRRERGPKMESMVRFELTHTAVYGTAALPVGATSPKTWPGREADHASSNSTLPDSHRSAGMSHAPITCELKFGAQGRT